MPRSTCALALLLGLALTGAAGAVDDATDLCPAVADPCFVNSTQLVTPGAVLDFGARGLEIGPNGRLDVGAGAMTIVVGSLKLHGGARVQGEGGIIGITVTGPVELAGASRIDVSADRPGWISLVGTDVAINGLITARATGVLDGGNIDLRAGAVTIGDTGRLTVSGGATGLGGLVTVLVDGAFTMDGAIDASGGDSGGAIEIDAALVSAPGNLDVSGGAGGSGAYVDVNSTGAVTLGTIQGSAPGTALIGSSGADVSVNAGGLVELNGNVTLNGGGIAGQGGTLNVSSSVDIVQRGAVVVSGPGAEGFGGEVILGAQGAVTLAEIDVSGLRRGGRVAVDAQQALTATSRVAADGTGEGAEAGSIGLHGCGLEVQATAVVSSSGPAGRNVLQASGAMVVRGTLVAGDENLLEYRDASVPPALLGSFAPLATVVLKEGLPPCGMTSTTLPPGPTTTTLPGQTCAAVFAGYDLVLCRLAAMNDVIARSSVTDLGGKATARKLAKKMSRIGTLVAAARTARRPTKRLKAAERQLASVVRIIQKRLDRSKFAPRLAEQLLDLARPAAAETKALRTGRR